MVQELKPLIDAKYPTLPDRENTAIGGSSMGGLMSLYGVTAHNETFSRAACLSPSVRFSFTEVKADIKKSKAGSRHAGLYQLGRARGQWPPRAGPVHRQGAGGHEPADRQGRDGLPLLSAGRQALRGRLAASAGALLYISVRMEVSRGKAKQKQKEKIKFTLYGYEPTVQEIAKELEVDVMDVVEAIDASYYPTSLSEPIYEKRWIYKFQWRKE